MKRKPAITRKINSAYFAFSDIHTASSFHVLLFSFSFYCNMPTTASGALKLRFCPLPLEVQDLLMFLLSFSSLLFFFPIQNHLLSVSQIKYMLLLFLAIIFYFFFLFSRVVLKSFQQMTEKLISLFYTRKTEV